MSIPPQAKAALVISVLALFGLENVVAFQHAMAKHVRAPRQHPSPHPPPVAAGQFGDSLPGLTADQAAAFDDGQEEFKSVDTVDSGLGPIFNNVSCVACHSSPATGGSSDILETRFGHSAGGTFDPMTALGGSLLQEFFIDKAVQEVVPDGANVIAQRKTTPLFGLGLIEAISDLSILQYALEPKPDGISGRPSIVHDVATGQTRIGRFGWKAQQATLLAFAGDAYLNEMGITNRLFPVENAPNGNQQLLDQFDAVDDPEDQVDPATGKADIDKFADFMRFLGAPPPLPLTSSAKAGAQVFAQVGCDNCHRPTMMTAPNAIHALDRKLVPLFSDLLLHDMGSLGDGIAQGTAKQTEMKTAPLWGLRVRAPYLHHGLAATVDAAIRLHDGEAARTRDRYVKLSPALRAQLLDFLNSL